MYLQYPEKSKIECAFYILYGLEASEGCMLILRSRVTRLVSPQKKNLSQVKVDFFEK